MAIPEPIEERLVSLDTEAAALTKSVNRLTEALKRYRRFMIALGVSFALDIALTATGFYVIHSLENTNHRLKATVARQNTQTNKAFCPLYGLFLSLDTPAARKALPPDQLADHDRQFKVIRDGYAALECRPTLP